MMERLLEMFEGFLCFAIGVTYIVLFSYAIYWVANRGECVERIEFDTTDQIVGAKGSYCAKWEN